MKKLLFVFLWAVLCVLILLPTSEAGQRGQSPNGPRRESPPNSGRAKTKNNRKEAKSTAKPTRALQGQQIEPVSITASNFAESAPLSQVAAAPAQVESDQSNEEEEAAENRTVRFITDSAIQQLNKMSTSQRSKIDQALQPDAPILPNIPSPINSFDGISNADNFAAFGGRVSPPDTDGDVGPNHYVQQVNLLVR